MQRCKVIVVIAIFSLLSGPLWAQQVDFADMTLEQLMRVPIESSTGILIPISEAPAVVSVITAEEIEAMGALTLNEVLATVPGLHMKTGGDQMREMSQIPRIRGIESQSLVLIMVNGVATNQHVGGGPAQDFDLPVAGIARVEVIRGPGSAVYGADAFAGLINIITKDAEDINGAEIGLRGGSFSTMGAWAQYGGKVGEWDLSLSADWLKTDGDDGRIITSDFQSVFDGIFGTSASLAPGPADTRYDLLNVQLGLERGNWKFGLWNWESNDRGVGGGGAEALDHTGWVDSTCLIGDISYTNSDIAEDLTLTVRTVYTEKDADIFYHVLPAGTLLPIGADGNAFTEPIVGLVLFEDGYIGNPSALETTLGLDFVTVYEGWENHVLRVGVGYEDRDLETSERKNFGGGVLDIGTVGLPLPPVVGEDMLTDISNTPYIYLPDMERNLWYLSLQDVWAIGENWEATLGVRYDDYSDFGNTVNPRLGLVWSGSSSFTAKLLYGSAFHAPPFNNLVLQGNPSGIGNPNLEPEEIDTMELAIDYRPSNKFRTVLNFFSYDVKGLIDLVPWPENPNILWFENFTDLDGYGFEVEVFFDVTSKLRLRSNYSWQHAEDKDTGARVANVPTDMFFLSAHWRPTADWSIYTKGKWISDQRRDVGDPRPPTESYTMVDLTLRRKSIADHVDLGVTVTNLFDEEAWEPSSSFIPDGIPLQGRAFLAEVVFKF